MNQYAAWLMIRRRARRPPASPRRSAIIRPRDGITAYLRHGGALEHAQEMAAHESPRTTKLYDRTRERLTEDEVEKKDFEKRYDRRAQISCNKPLQFFMNEPQEL